MPYILMFIYACDVLNGDINDRMFAKMLSYNKCYNIILYLHNTFCDPVYCPRKKI